MPHQKIKYVIFIPLSASFLLLGYEALRSASNTLFKAAYGVENLALIMSAIPVVVLAMVAAYGYVLSKIGPRRTLWVTILFSTLVMVGCWGAIRSGSKIAVIVIYLFRQAYIVLIIEQYWSFLNSTFGDKEARIFNGPVIGLSSAGAIVGGLLTHWLSEPLGTQNMLLVGAAATLPSALLADLAFRFCGEPQSSENRSGSPKTPGTSPGGPQSPQPDRKGLSAHIGLRELLANKLLLGILAIIICTQVISAAFELAFQGILQEAIPKVDAQNAYSGSVFATLNFAALVLQFVGAPIALRFLPVLLIIGAIPLVHMASAATLIFYPTLSVATGAFLIFKSLDYSLFRAAKEILYLPLSFDARYRAKELIDVFGYRFGSGAIALVIHFLQKASYLLSGLFGFLALSGSVVWLGLVVLAKGWMPEDSKERDLAQIGEDSRLN